MIISVVDSRQSGCSYNVKSSFVEKRRTCYRVSVVCEGLTSQQDSIWKELKI